MPRCALFAEDSIVQSVPEHPKKENVFCLSNSFADVYLFQVPLSFLHVGGGDSLPTIGRRRSRTKGHSLVSNRLVRLWIGA